MNLWWSFWLLAFIGILLLLRYHWSRRHLYWLAYNLPGPTALPIVGNGLTCLGSTEVILNQFSNLMTKYPTPFRLWIGPLLLIFFSKMRHIEKILSSSKITDKHEFYDILKIYLGDGLITSAGRKWKQHRKIIQPLINLKFVTQKFESFQFHINICMKKLEKCIDGKTFDIYYFMHYCNADIIGESILGITMNAQHGENREYTEATVKVFDCGYSRLRKPWKYPDVLYNLSPNMKIQNRLIAITTNFMKYAINKSRLRIKLNTKNLNDEIDENENSTFPIIDQLAASIKKKPESMDETDFVFQMFTLYMASEDTLTLITSFLALFLGMYPEYQKKAAEEIHSIFGDTPRDVTYDDIQKLNYLDMCMKESLRLIPVGPILARKATQDIKIDNLTIPKDCGVLISIFSIHRDPEHWERPEEFYPDHFLPEAVSKRHAYAYIPFSAGPRNCVGKLLAANVVKLMAANILQRFEIEADGDISDIKLKADTTVRSQNGYPVRLKKRVWI